MGSSAKGRAEATHLPAGPPRLRRKVVKVTAAPRTAPGVRTATQAGWRRGRDWSSHRAPCPSSLLTGHGQLSSGRWAVLGGATAAEPAARWLEQNGGWCVLFSEPGP